jgi:chromate transporter
MATDEIALEVAAVAPGGRTVRGLVLYFLKLGSIGFGGPIALCGYMHRDLVEERGWYSDDEYQQGLAVAQTMPGPLAAQLAMWLGYLEAGSLGALAVTVPFVVPPFLIVTAVAIVYSHYQGLAIVSDIFFGVGPAVMAIVAIAAYKLSRSTNKRDPVLWLVAAILCAATAISGAEIVWLFLLAGAFGAIYYGGGLPRRLPGGAASLTPLPLLAGVDGFAWIGGGASLGAMAVFFAKAGAFTFGSGLAIVPFLHEGLVASHHWLTEQQFTDAVAMGLISPGPVVIMATFAGYLVYGVVGAAVATAAVFVPVYLFVVVPGRFFRRHEKHARLQGFVKGATAAAAGAIAGAAIVIGRQTITSWAAAVIGVIALAVLLQKRVKVGEPVLVAAAAVVGILVHSGGAAAAAGGLPLQTVARVELPGPSVRFDYESLDPASSRLYLAHMDAGRLLVFDVRTRRLINDIAAPGVHGVLAVPALHRVYASATDDHQVLTIDGRSGRVLAHAAAGEYPDGLAYDPADRRVFVSDESGGVEIVIDAAGRRLGAVALGGEAGNVQYDPVARLVYVDVQTRNELAVIDPRRRRVIRRVHLPGCEHDHGLYVDAPRRLAFVACDGNATLLTLDLTRMKVTGRASLGPSPDVLAFDSASRRLYVAAESGVVAVFRERGDKLVKLGQASLAPEAHTVAVDPRSHLVYFALQQGTSGKPQLLIMKPTGR